MNVENLISKTGIVSVMYVSFHNHGCDVNDLGSVPLPLTARQDIAEKLYMGPSMEKILASEYQPNYMYFPLQVSRPVTVNHQTKVLSDDRQ